MQRYVEAAQDGVVLASQPRPNCKDLLSRSRPRGRVSANLQPSTVEVEEASQQIEWPPRLRFEPARVRDCKQMRRRPSLDEAEIEGMIYACPRDLCCRGRFFSSRDNQWSGSFFLCIRHFVFSRDSQPRDFCVRRFIGSTDSRPTDLCVRPSTEILCSTFLFV